MPRRVERLNEQFRREVTEILRGEAKDPRVGLATLTGARVAPDLSSARIFVSPLGDEAAQREMLEGLRAATPFVRSELGRRLHIRRVPELRFELDETLEHARRIEALLSEVRGGDGTDGAAPPPPADDEE